MGWCLGKAKATLCPRWPTFLGAHAGEAKHARLLIVYAGGGHTN